MQRHARLHSAAEPGVVRTQESPRRRSSADAVASGSSAVQAARGGKVGRHAALSNEDARAPRRTAKKPSPAKPAAAASAADASDAVRSRIPGLKRFLVASAVIVAVLALVAGLLSWNQWFRYDDAADIQGTWTIQGSDAQIVISDSSITLTDDVSYGYELDTFAKTIAFSYANYSGEGSYAFSPERTELVITEKGAGDAGEVSTKLVKRS